MFYIDLYFVSITCLGDHESRDGTFTLDEAVKSANVELQTENKNLNSLVTSLHEKHHKASLKLSEMKDALDSAESRNEELKARVDDLEFELNRSRSKEIRLQEQLQEAREKLNTVHVTPNETDYNNGSTTKSAKNKNENNNFTKIDELQKELEEYKELSNKRLFELESLNTKHKDALTLVEKLKMDLQSLPESAVIETVEYKCLQSHFSVLYNESMQLKTQLEETRVMMQNAKNSHHRQIEKMESEELSIQKRLRTDIIQLEDQLEQGKREYEMLRLEFEQAIAANEQTGPINKEMRHLITSLQNHNIQLKGEAQRYKRRLKDLNHEYNKIKHICETQHQPVLGSIKQEVKPKINPESNSNISPENPAKRPRLDSESSSQLNENLKNSADKKPVVGIDANNTCEVTIKKEELSSPNSSHSSNIPGAAHPPPPTRTNHTIKKEEDGEHGPPSHSSSSESKKHDPDHIIRDLKNQLKMLSQQNKELKLIVDIYKNNQRDQRDKVALMIADRKNRVEIDELRKKLSRYQTDGDTKPDRRKYTDDDTQREIAKYKESILQLQKSLATQKQEDEALLNEMELTGNAFEDMQDQNLRLMQQLREKDDANFKLMSERIKSQGIQKLLKEEKENLNLQVINLKAQVEAQNQVVRKLEEKERLLQNNLSTVEKELCLTQQAMESHRRKAIESAQSAADLKLHLDKYLAQLKEAQSTVADKTTTLQQEAFKNQRLQEEVMTWRRMYERAKKFELANTADEVLQEEIKDYKSQLTCPSCKTNRKDAVLTKCFHVFCYDCLKTRYETRQRKCPKCNASFAANDFHRLYLA